MKDCALICRTAGLKPAANLRELHARVESCPIAALYHHFCETKLRPSFDDPEYPNDFAAWSARALHDQTLAERLAMLNGFEYEDLEQLRTDTMDILDDRLAEIPSLGWAMPGEHFELIQAMTIVFDTGATCDSLQSLADTLVLMNRGAIYFHYLEARRRPPLGIDDFSVWLGTWAEPPQALVAALAEIDFHLLTLHDLKDRLIAVVQHHLHNGGS